MLMRLAVCIIVMMVGMQGLWAQSAPDMSWRVFYDKDSETAFRFPYHYAIPDQYAGGVNISAQRSIRFNIPVNATPAQQAEIRKQMQARLGSADHADIRHFSVLATDLPASVDQADVRSVLAHVSGQGLTDFSDFDYYAREEQRPHANAKWALAGIIGVQGSGSKAYGLCVSHEGRFSGLLIKQAVPAAIRQGIIDSFEVSSGRKSGKKIRGERYTWLHYQAVKKGAVRLNSGDMVPVRSKAAPSSWAERVEVETAHYHITGSVSPVQAAYYARYHEALYELYAKVFNPEDMPPYKMEIHICENLAQMSRLAQLNGFAGIPSRPENNSVLAGFFSPTNLSIFAFHHPPKGWEHLNPMRTLAHEASHQFLHMACNGSQHVPTWINEGLAVYFESVAFSGKAVKWNPPSGRLDRYEQIIRQRKATLWPIETYIRHGGPIPAENYAEVYAITHYWVYGDKRGRQFFRDYWKALRAGENGATAFERIFLSAMIDAQGSRDAALAAWQQTIVKWVSAKKTRRAK